MTIILNNPECQWEQDTKATMTRYNLEPEQLEGTKYQTKANVKNATERAFKTEIEQQAAQGKSKILRQ